MVRLGDKTIHDMPRTAQIHVFSLTLCSYWRCWKMAPKEASLWLCLEQSSLSMHPLSPRHHGKFSLLFKGAHVVSDCVCHHVSQALTVGMAVRCHLSDGLHSGCGHPTMTQTCMFLNRHLEVAPTSLDSLNWNKLVVGLDRFDRT